MTKTPNPNPRRLRSVFYHPIFVFNLFALFMCIGVAVFFAPAPLATLIAFINIAIVLARDTAFKLSLKRIKRSNAERKDGR